MIPRICIPRSTTTHIETIEYSLNVIFGIIKLMLIARNAVFANTGRIVNIQKYVLNALYTRFAINHASIIIANIINCNTVLSMPTSPEAPLVNDRLLYVSDNIT